MVQLICQRKIKVSMRLFFTPVEISQVHTSHYKIKLKFTTWVTFRYKCDPDIFFFTMLRWLCHPQTDDPAVMARFIIEPMMSSDITVILLFYVLGSFLKPCLMVSYRIRGDSWRAKSPQEHMSSLHHRRLEIWSLFLMCLTQIRVGKYSKVSSR